MLWLLEKEPKLVFSKVLWWSLQTFSQFIHLERKAQLKSSLFILNQTLTDKLNKVQLSSLILKLLTQKVLYSKLAKHTMLTNSWNSSLILVLHLTDKILMSLFSMKNLERDISIIHSPKFNNSPELLLLIHLILILMKEPKHILKLKRDQSYGLVNALSQTSWKLLKLSELHMSDLPTNWVTHRCTIAINSTSLMWEDQFKTMKQMSTLLFKMFWTTKLKLISKSLFTPDS